MTAKKAPSLQSPEIDSVWALRLLCEAWLLTKWPPTEPIPETLPELKNALQIKTDKPQLPKGIVLTAPTTADTWLAPFVANGGGDPLDSILNQLTGKESKDVVQNFFQKLKTGPIEFNDVVKLFFELDAVIKTSI